MVSSLNAIGLRIEGGGNALAFVVTGQVRHRKLTPPEVRSALAAHFQGLTDGDFDFYMDRIDCRVDFFCNNSVTLDFTVSCPTSRVPQQGIIARLVQETDALAEGIALSFEDRLSRPKITLCSLEDQRSRNVLLERRSEQPLRSPGARLSYILSLLLLFTAGALAFWLNQEDHAEWGNPEIISIGIALVLPALTLPLPFVFDWLRNRRTTRWIFAQRGARS